MDHPSGAGEPAQPGIGGRGRGGIDGNDVGEAVGEGEARGEGIVGGEGEAAGDRAEVAGAQAGRALRVLEELGLVSLDRETRTATVPIAERTALERAAAFRAYQAVLEDGRRWLRRQTARAA